MQDQWYTPPAAWVGFHLETDKIIEKYGDYFTLNGSSIKCLKPCVAEFYYQIQLWQTKAASTIGIELDSSINCTSRNMGVTTSGYCLVVQNNIQYYLFSSNAIFTCKKDDEFQLSMSCSSTDQLLVCQRDDGLTTFMQANVIKG